MTRKEGSSQIGFLNYLPQKAAGTTKGATLWQFKMICVSAAAFSPFPFPPTTHSHPLPCASTGICLTGTQAGSQSYTGRKLFYSLQKMMFPASIGPPNLLPVGKGGLSVLVFAPLESTSLVWQTVMKPQSNRADYCRSEKQEGKVNYLSHFYCQMHEFKPQALFFLTTTLCGIRMTVQGTTPTQRTPHTSDLLSKLWMGISEATRIFTDPASPNLSISIYYQNKFLKTSTNRQGETEHYRSTSKSQGTLSKLT